MNETEPSSINDTAFCASTEDEFDYEYMPFVCIVENQASCEVGHHRTESKVWHNGLYASAQRIQPKYKHKPNLGVLTTENLAGYMAWCDLVSSSLYNFDDKAENFRA